MQNPKRMNISGPAAVAKPEMLFYAPGDLTVTIMRFFGVRIAVFFFAVGDFQIYTALIVF